MKTGSFTPKPGELFQWYYDSDDSSCYYDDKLYSRPMGCNIFLTGINLLISLTDSDIWWLNNQNFFYTYMGDTTTIHRWSTAFIHARVDDTSTNHLRPGGDRIQPRKYS